MNGCLLITYFSTNNSIIITKREIRNFFIATFTCSRNFIAKKPPKKHSNFHRNFFEKLPRNQELKAATSTKKAREILGGLAIGPLHQHFLLFRPAKHNQNCDGSNT